MRFTTTSRILLSVVIVGGTSRTPDAAPERPVDSGRYGFDAVCSQDGRRLNCRLTIRDLVYDTVLGEPELSVLSTSDGGRLGAGVAFEGNPARGTPQRITWSLNPDPMSPGRESVRLIVEVKEGEHLVQRHSLALTTPILPAAELR